MKRPVPEEREHIEEELVHIDEPTQESRHIPDSASHHEGLCEDTEKDLNKLCDEAIQRLTSPTNFKFSWE